MTQIRLESGMKLLYDDERTFLIEDFVKNKKINHVKCVEFVRKIKKDVFYFIEAKSSAPNPYDAHNQENTVEHEGVLRFKEYIQEIIEKAVNSHIIFYEVLLRRYTPTVPQQFMPSDYAAMQYHLVLIIKNHKKEWLPPINNALQQGMLPYCKASQWGSMPIIVINESTALEKGFIEA